MPGSLSCPCFIYFIRPFYSTAVVRSVSILAVSLAGCCTGGKCPVTAALRSGVFPRRVLETDDNIVVFVTDWIAVAICNEPKSGD